MSDLSAPSERAISFGPFRLFRAQRVLFEGDKPLRLGSRALEVLIALVERAGELVSKDELMARVWPHATVDESNLKVHVAALRRALADGQGGHRYLLTVPGRGYRFVAPISAAEGASAAQSPSAKRLHNLPTMLTRLIGRADTVSQLAQQLPRRRFLTIVGTGGVGTTSVALALAEALLSSYEDGVWFVELAPLVDPLLVPAALAAALGLELRTEDLLPALLAALRDKQMLLVLDNCEHVIDAAAGLAASILSEAASVHILATSREPLRAAGEYVHRLRPLASPPREAQLTAAEALTYPAVQLFVERAAASLGEFELHDADAPSVADICAKLDGVPLAIEFAAARADAFGVQGLASRLDDRLRLLTSGRRTALPRHRTMRATLDWSYEFLPARERLVLQSLAVFAGACSLEAAIAVIASSEVAASEIPEEIANLVAKSLISADVGGAVVVYRLLETTRAYALEKLVESGQLQQFARRHAEYYCDLLEGLMAEWATKPAAEAIADHRRHIDEVRSALDWAFSPNGDASIGLALTAAAVPLCLRLSLLNECRQRVERAISYLGPDSDPRREMQLYEALGQSLAQTMSPLAETNAAWKNVLALAEKCDDTEYRLRALWGLYNYHLTVGNDRACLAFAERFRDLATQQSEPADVLVGHRMIGTALHCLGNQSEARHHLEHMLDRSVAPAPPSQILRFQFDQRVLAQVFLSRILWLQGFPEQAIRMAHSSVEDAQAIGHPLSVCIALADAACPVGLFIGDHASVEANAAILLERSAKHGLHIWNAWARGISGAVFNRRGDTVTGVELLRSAMNEIRGTGFVQRNRIFFGIMAQGLFRAGHAAEGLSVIDQGFAQSGDSEEHWYLAELLRIKGELLLLAGMPGATATAELHFRHALDCARRQGALSWELRSATSLARLWQLHTRSREARKLLTETYERFTEGFDTRDLQAAKSLIEDLS